MKFNTLQITESILKAIDDQGYQEATPIQEKAIPVAMQGKDILGCAQTGTGKTAAFSIPTIQLLGKHDKTKIRALILTPTRELAIQIQENVSAYAKYTTIKSTVIFGGVPQRPQEKAIKEGVDIMIATPGRLNDLLKQRIVDLSQIEIFILDEADRMLDMGFLVDVKRIIAKLKPNKQTMLFSATMPKEIKALAHTLLHEPETIEVSPVSSTVNKIEQTLYYVDKANKKRLLVDILRKEKIESALIFTRTKSNANRLTKFLISENIKTGVIHGNKSQSARQMALADFKSGKSTVLVATDIAARGIDINELSHVFNYDLPNEAEAYVHRIGRTGRAGREGVSISFADIDEVAYVKSIQKLIKIEIPVNRDHDYPMTVLTLTPKTKPNHNRSTPKNTAKTSSNTAAKQGPKNGAKQGGKNTSKSFVKKGASNNSSHVRKQKSQSRQHSSRHTAAGK